MNSIFSYDPKTQRFGMQWEGNTYFFTYDLKTYAVKNAWNSDGKLIARSYKGFRNKLGVTPATPKSQAFLSTINQAITYLNNQL